MFGEGVHPGIDVLFETRIAPFLSQKAFTFWSTRLWYFKTGLYYQGGMVRAARCVLGWRARAVLRPRRTRRLGCRACVCARGQRQRQHQVGPGAARQPHVKLSVAGPRVLFVLCRARRANCAGCCSAWPCCAACARLCGG
jgi:hypothetical protein